MVAALAWAIRSGQFRSGDHARRLALESRIPDDEEWARLQCAAAGAATRVAGSDASSGGGAGRV